MPDATSDAARVAVVRNENSPSSRRIADDYVERRGIPHVISVSCQDSAEMAGIDEMIEKAGRMRQVLEDAGYPVSPLPLFPEVARQAESIDAADYRRQIEAPVRAYLADHPEVDIIVTTKGVPIRVTGVPTPTGLMKYSLDALLSVLGYDALGDAIPVTLRDRTLTLFFGDAHATAWVNRYWNSDRPFSHREFGGYLVSRLDGYTVEDALALTTRALAAEAAADAGTSPTAPVLVQAAPGFSVRPKPGAACTSTGAVGFGRTEKPWLPFAEFTDDGAPQLIDGESRQGDFNNDLDVAAALVTLRGFPALSVDGGDPIPDVELLGYASWGSNDPRFDPAHFAALRFAPGAVAETAVSTGARSMIRLAAAGGQSMIADLVAQGVSAVRGYTDEPLLQAIASPRILFERYSRGWTAVESFAAAAGFVGWQELLLGDPLARAYPRLG